MQEGQKRVPPYVKKRRNWQPVALLLILLLIACAGVYYYTATHIHPHPAVAKTHGPKEMPGYAMHECAYGDRKELMLADSTRVILNSHTYLYVPEGFPQTSRTIILDGEAFFSVQKLADSALIVHTDKLAVSADTLCLFRLRSLDIQGGATFYLLSGNAVVAKTYPSDMHEPPERLKAGDMILANRDIDLMEKEKFELVEQQECLERKIVFDKTPVSAAIRKIEDVYGIELELRGEGTLPESFTGNFGGDLNDMLTALGKSGGFTHKIMKDKVVIQF